MYTELTYSIFYTSLTVVPEYHCFSGIPRFLGNILLKDKKSNKNNWIKIEARFFQTFIFIFRSSNQNTF